MDLGELALRAGQIVFAVIAVLALTTAGGAAARRLGQDRVIGEIVVGLLVAPTILLLAGPELLRRLLPAGMMSGLKVVAEVGLVLFLVGVTHRLDIGLGGVRRRAVGWVALGALVPALCLGAGLGGWLVHSADPAVRGGAPAPAFVVFMAVAMAITAVPVLARILLDRGMADSAVGRVALAAAILADSVGWLILSIAVSLNAANPATVVRSLLVLAGGGLVALLLRRVLRARGACAFGARHPRLAVFAVAAVALAVAFGTERLGLTAIIGAVLVGLAIPTGDRVPWPAAVSVVSRAGRRLVPLYFGVTGFLVFASAPSVVSWGLVASVLALGIVGKVGGGYLGARLAGQDRWDSLRIGALMNTRGLTELVVLRVGYDTGILTGALFLIVLIMALVTTMLTGPLLVALARLQRRAQPAAEASVAGGAS